MDKQNTGENLLTRMYNLFSLNKEKDSIENELKISNLSDKTGEIFNFNVNDNIFGSAGEKTIFDLNNNVNLVQNKRNQNIGKASGSGNNKNNSSNNILDPDIIKNFNSAKNEISPELGNNLDQIG